MTTLTFWRELADGVTYNIDTQYILWGLGFQFGSCERRRLI